MQRTEPLQLRVMQNRLEIMFKRYSGVGLIEYTAHIVYNSELKR